MAWQQCVEDNIYIRQERTMIPTNGGGATVVAATQGYGYFNTYISGPYQDNMKVINRNFALQSNVNQQISEQLTSLNTSSIHLNEQLNLLMLELQEQKTAVQNLTTIVNNLSNHVTRVLQFLPEFVRQSSSNFMRLMLGIRNGAPIELEEIRVIQN